MSPSLVLITATSFDEFMGVFCSFFSSALNIAELISTASKIDSLMLTCGTMMGRCHAASLKSRTRRQSDWGAEAVKR
jgi:hypothetical protein